MRVQEKGTIAHSKMHYLFFAPMGKSIATIFGTSAILLPTYVFLQQTQTLSTGCHGFPLICRSTTLLTPGSQTSFANNNGQSGATVCSKTSLSCRQPGQKIMIKGHNFESVALDAPVENGKQYQQNSRLNDCQDYNQSWPVMCCPKHSIEGLHHYPVQQAFPQRTLQCKMPWSLPHTISLIGSLQCF